MRVYLLPTGLYSRAMVRVARALSKNRPHNVSIAANINDADLAVLHVISPDAVSYATNLAQRGINYAVIQYCLGLGHPPEIWHGMWNSAEVVWSYYDLEQLADYQGDNFYHAPLGVDDVFINHESQGTVRNRVITTGYVSGPFAEPIEEVWIAASRAGVEAIHIGPSIVKGITDYPPNWRAITPIDTELAELYSTSRWVSGMRHVEGFELPAAEGLARGCRPIVFDQPTMRQWYGDRVEYVEECSGEELIGKLQDIFVVGVEQGSRDIGVFDWKVICGGFWARIGDNRS